MVFEIYQDLTPGIHGSWVKVVSAGSLQSKLKTFRVAPRHIEEQVPTSWFVFIDSRVSTLLWKRLLLPGKYQEPIYCLPPSLVKFGCGWKFKFYSSIWGPTYCGNSTSSVYQPTLGAQQAQVTYLGVPGQPSSEQSQQLYSWDAT